MLRSKKIASLNTSYFTKQNIDCLEDDVLKFIENKEFTDKYEFTKSDIESTFAKEIINQIKGRYSIIDNEIPEWSMTLYKPSKNNIEILPPTGIQLRHRHILVVGSKDVMTIKAIHGKLAANTSIYLSTTEMVQIPLALSSAVTCIFDCARSAMIPPRRTGGRSIKIVKNPSKRFILVVDGHPSIKEGAKYVEKMVSKTSHSQASTSQLDDELLREIKKDMPEKKEFYDE